MVGSVLDYALAAAAHELRDQIRLAIMVSKVEDCDYVRVRAEPAHSLGIAGDAGPGGFIQTLGLDE